MIPHWDFRTILDVDPDNDKTCVGTAHSTDNRRGCGNVIARPDCDEASQLLNKMNKTEKFLASVDTVERLAELMLCKGYHNCATRPEYNQVGDISKKWQKQIRAEYRVIERRQRGDALLKAKKESRKTESVKNERRKKISVYRDIDEEYASFAKEVKGKRFVNAKPRTSTRSNGPSVLCNGSINSNKKRNVAAQILPINASLFPPAKTISDTCSPLDLQEFPLPPTTQPIHDLLASDVTPAKELDVTNQRLSGVSTRFPQTNISSTLSTALVALESALLPLPAASDSSSVWLQPLPKLEAAPGKVSKLYDGKMIYARNGLEANTATVADNTTEMATEFRPNTEDKTPSSFDAAAYSPFQKNEKALAWRPKVSGTSSNKSLLQVEPSTLGVWCQAPAYDFWGKGFDQAYWMEQPAAQLLAVRKSPVRMKTDERDFHVKQETKTKKPTYSFDFLAAVDVELGKDEHICVPQVAKTSLEVEKEGVDSLPAVTEPVCPRYRCRSPIAEKIFVAESELPPQTPSTKIPRSGEIDNFKEVGSKQEESKSEQVFIDDQSDMEIRPDSAVELNDESNQPTSANWAEEEREPRIKSEPEQILLKNITNALDEDKNKTIQPPAPTRRFTFLSINTSALVDKSTAPLIPLKSPRRLQDGAMQLELKLKAKQQPEATPNSISAAVQQRPFTPQATYPNADEQDDSGEDFGYASIKSIERHATYLPSTRSRSRLQNTWTFDASCPRNWRSASEETLRRERKPLPALPVDQVRGLEPGMDVSSYRRTTSDWIGASVGVQTGEKLWRSGVRSEAGVEGEGNNSERESRGDGLLGMFKGAVRRFRGVGKGKSKVLV